MPNHCENKVTIHAKQDFIAEFKKKYFTKEGDFNFDAIIPYPDEYKEQDRIASLDSRIPTFGEDGYNWRVENWGTKWNGYETEFCDEADLGDGDGWFQFRVLSAWDSPMPIFFKLAKMHADEMQSFEVEYEIEGHMGAGYVAWQDGELVDDYMLVKEYGIHAQRHAEENK